MLLKDRIIGFIFKCATNTKRIRTLLTPVGAFFFLLFFTLFVLLSLETDKLLNLTKLFPSNLITYFSIPFFGIGIFFTSWSVIHFLKAKGTPVPLNPPPLLITKGPYKYIRNPMLTGLFFILFGLGMGLNSFSLLFLFTPLFIAINYLELTLIEEPELLKRLGNEYYIYRNNTPMFIPGLKPKKTNS